MKEMVCLDIGGSAGFVAKAIAPYVEKVYVVDIDRNALKFGKRHNRASNIFFRVGDAMDLPFADGSIDLVVCNQVYEHVPDYNVLAKEVHRVLKGNGLCYFSAGNRFCLIEQHHGLPLLSWLPKRIANLYLEIFRNEDFYYENHLSYFGLKRLLNKFTIHDFTLEVIKNPVKFRCTDTVKPKSFFTKIPVRVLKLLEPIIPTFIFVLTKKER